jgi:pilus assembly protein CpaE
MAAFLRVDILVSGRDSVTVRGVAALLTGLANFSPTVRVGTEGIAHPLAGLPGLPDVLVLCCNDTQLGDLRELAALPAANRPPIVICGALRTAEGTRLAIRCGAADLLPAVPTRAELVEAINRAAAQSVEQSSPVKAKGSVICVLGVAGGVGASFVATNLAHLAIQRDQEKAIIVDLDLQYAPLTAHLGMKPELGLVQALERVDTLDRVALEGYLARHRTGLALMASAGDGAVDPNAVSAERFRQLLQMLSTQFDRVVIDASRMLDGLSTTAVLDAEHVILVLEQSIGNIHNGSRLFALLTRHLGVNKDRIVPVINRFSRRSPITPSDIERTVGCGEPLLVGSEYELARESLDAAVPLVERDRKSLLSRALGEINTRIAGAPEPASTGGFLRRANSLFRKGDL